MPINSLQRTRDPSAGKLRAPSALAPYPRLELSGRSRAMPPARVLFLRGAKRETQKGNIVNELYRLLSSLGRTEIDHDLTGLEGAVWARVDERGDGLNALPRAAAASLFAAVALFASMSGVAAAAATLISNHAASPFAIAQPLAPATALGG